ncbi:DUF917 domain-containing protein [Fervidicoccus fontis]|uniref:DUF917 domain-containing protein n=1 Tax=Fervidicoccus fontis (strain DSM 19380 / JCM 18336 / VKM B-2539 / Kam940) TaxID=1163730 RepID=H9ZZ46_FERFK|nr:DUF917 domain-containing protein [Fervidicoccus fontis]AFH42003.1 hypothetical protein FFONT_0007 [Fervidicoccus fontis Kam940]
MVKELKNEGDVERLVIGATVLGTGGGGDPKEGYKALSGVLKEKEKPIKIADLESLPSDGVIVVPYYVGSIAPGLKQKKPVVIKDPISEAFEILEKELGKKVNAVVASEMGGSNTSIALSIGARRDLPAIDGDLLGRAAPELHQCTVLIFGYSMAPSALVTETGDVVVVKNAYIDDYEAIARYISVLGGGFVAVVDTPLTKEMAENAVVKGTMSLAYKLGDEILSAKARGERGNITAERVADLLRGWVVFEGIVSKYSWRDERGFLRGEAELRGKGDYAGRKLRSWIMNEHIMVWINDESLVMPPDIFTLLSSDGNPVTNTDLKEGMEVIAVAAPSPKVWRTERGLELFGPKHFGFNLEYIPVEELVSRRGIA